jgi:hypothetical protein
VVAPKQYGGGSHADLNDAHSAGDGLDSFASNGASAPPVSAAAPSTASLGDLREEVKWRKGAVLAAIRQDTPVITRLVSVIFPMAIDVKTRKFQRGLSTPLKRPRQKRDNCMTS